MPFSTAEKGLKWIDVTSSTTSSMDHVHSPTDSKTALPNGKTFLISKSPAVTERVQNLKGVSSSSEKKIEAPSVEIRQVIRKQESFKMLKKFDGVVTSLEDDVISIRLYEGNSRLPQADVSFGKEEFPENDRPLIAEGIPIIWTIGLGKRESGSVEKKSIVYVRRIIPPTQEEYKVSMAEIESLYSGPT